MTQGAKADVPHPRRATAGFSSSLHDPGNLVTIVYLLQSVKNPSHFYVGQTTDIVERLQQHNSSQIGHTVKFRPWKLVVAIHFEDAAKAASFERYLKSGSGRAFAKRHF